MKSRVHSMSTALAALSTVVFVLVFLGSSLFTELQHAQAVNKQHSATVVIDGVTITVSSPILPAAQFSTPMPGQGSQNAIMTSISPYQEVSILAVPFGTKANLENLPQANQGDEGSYREKLHTLRTNQGAILLANPSVTLFNATVHGEALATNLPLHGIINEPSILAEWVYEAGKREWIVRVLVERSVATSWRGGISSYLQSLSSVNIASNSLNAPSTLPQASAVGSNAQVMHSTNIVLPSDLHLMNDLAFPSWWNGSNCDAGRNASAYPLGDSYLGMPACGPRPDYDSCSNYCNYPEYFYSGAVENFEFQCVELVSRYMYLAYYVAPYSANGNSVVSNYPGSVLTKVQNGSGQLPSVGDVISFNVGSGNGHTALVVATNVTNGNGTITILQQNFGGNGYGHSNDEVPYNVSNYTLSDTFGMHATAWLHPHPAQTIGVYRNFSGGAASNFILSGGSGSNFGGGPYATISLGNTGYIPLAGNWTGNGVDYVGVYIPSTATFALTTSNTPGAPITYAFTFGNPNWIPLVGDWMGTGKDSIGVYNPQNQEFFLKNTLPPASSTVISGGNADSYLILGSSGDIPIAGKWGTAWSYTGIGVYRPGNQVFYLSSISSGGSPTTPKDATPGVIMPHVEFGSSGDIPLTGDWSGNGQTSIGVYRPSNQEFYLKSNPTTTDNTLVTPAFPFGNPGDIPVTGNWGNLS